MCSFFDGDSLRVTVSNANKGRVMLLDQIRDKDNVLSVGRMSCMLTFPGRQAFETSYVGRVKGENFQTLAGIANYEGGTQDGIYIFLPRDFTSGVHNIYPLQAFLTRVENGGVPETYFALFGEVNVERSAEEDRLVGTFFFYTSTNAVIDGKFDIKGIDPARTYEKSSG